MRISIFTDSFLPYYSGVSCAIINQANELIRRGHDIAIFRPKPIKNRNSGFDDLNPRAEVHDIPVSIPNPRIKDLHVVIPSVLSSYNQTRMAHPDIIHVHTEWGCGWEGLMIARMLRVPVVGTFHTFFAEPEYLKHFNIPDFAATKAIMWRYSVFFYNQCENVISPSQSVIRELKRNGLTKDPILVSNGITFPDAGDPAAAGRLRERHGVAGPTAIYIGRVADEKSLGVVVEALSLLRARRPDARLLIIGSGPGDEKLDADIAAFHVQEGVNRLGFIPHDKLVREQYPLLGDVFVTASKTENQPVSILEAMSFGLPFIGVDAKGIPELIEDGVNGRLVPPDDPEAFAAAMEEVMYDEALRSRMAAASSEMIRQHDIVEVGAQIEQIYQTTMDG